MRITTVQGRSSAMPGSEEIIDFHPRVTEYWEGHETTYVGETGLYDSVTVVIPDCERPSNWEPPRPPWLKD